MTSFFKKAVAGLIVIYVVFCLLLVLILSHYSIEQDTYVVLTHAPDFKAIEDISERKQAFFDYFAPIIQQKNTTLRRLRAELLAISAKYLADKKLSRRQQARLAWLLEEYFVSRDIPVSEQLNELEKRVNTLPMSLVLAQAAKESAWGTSRFAREGNNFFGEWCFTEGCGIVPKNRRSGAYHEVRTFSFPAQSLFSYFRNLNTHPAYGELRELRSRITAANQTVTGLSLVPALGNYSERRERYIKELKVIITGNNLEEYATELAKAQ